MDGCHEQARGADLAGAAADRIHGAVVGHVAAANRGRNVADHHSDGHHEREVEHADRPHVIAEQELAERVDDEDPGGFVLTPAS